MRVAMFSWESLHSMSVGGIAQHVTELAAAVQRRGHEVHVFTRRGDGQSDVEEFYGVVYHRVSLGDSGGDFMAAMSAMCNAMAWAFGVTQSRIGKFDVCHAHDWMTCKAMVQCKNEHGTPCVFTFHSTEAGRSQGWGQDAVRAWEGEAAFVADRLIAVSDRLMSEVTSIYSVPSSKVWSIPNGIQCSRFDGYIDPGEVKGRCGIGAMDPMVLFVGRMVGGMKGADILAEAVPGILAAHGGTKVVFVGDGDSKMHCDHRTKELGVEGACRFLGARNGDELANLFKACDCVVVPSRNEPFGLVVLEAWAAGKPVVASDQVGCPVAHGHDGWTVSCTAEGIAWGVAQVLRDFNRAREMGANGRMRAAFVFSWDKVAETTERCYADVAGL
mmetsp:Transcript_31850/g.93165  ORF Transcript_31850/g.93165 Transcript_31850/m.93165 type:complete len:386 (+) Transcript_31850:73-1230(+)|eukprot:CAMPEP_0170241132 /NCGR_PEP_ID=MMETSP0116_2-20130129/20330_1 /TAXON_ID=400756 /ORGANISM="Durinskia baltica, Strain CSIRO CS-38" /LENGTH=385 /DNA_ID=CAMNT_0010491963 /DNA_START=64 /DNA_END=1221 /DNA_ORIENTATION=+